MIFYLFLNGVDRSLAVRDYLVRGQSFIELVEHFGKVDNSCLYLFWIKSVERHLVPRMEYIRVLIIVSMLSSILAIQSFRQLSTHQKLIF